ncbi:cupin domain-containing protein [Erysipelothrix sp. HDW6A]|uniref:cupin domain-containing protein n=1 Tax=Erysipelothrix sp. HDW6A TaxID=2714928 RepID=UPI0014072944|nr:cupin domain-containing protein [Erysipelothrix sp. HDW6A]QIK56521.1 cupin domain-containing protein [Erysipelothrix sp. HDW6A]
MLKNIKTRVIIELVNEVVYQEGQVVSKTLSQNDAMSLTLFAFDKGEGLSKHTALGDAMVTILDGSAKITIGNDEFFPKAGETLVMPANIPHSLDAIEPFKMQLLVVFK